jgi:hypothetical protein
VNTYDFYRTRLHDLERDSDYDPHDRMRAMERVVACNNWVTGVVYQDGTRQVPAGASVSPTAGAELRLSDAELNALLSSYR